MQAFIATLVMMLLLRGVTMVYTNGSPINTGFSDNADLFGWFGIGRPLGIPTPVWIMAIVFLAAWYMLHHTRLGRYIYALGGNEAATRLSGISVNKVKIIVYALCGMLASLAGSSKWRVSPPRSRRRGRAMSWTPLRRWCSAAPASLVAKDALSAR